MALQKDFTFTRDGFEGKLTAKNAYFKVSTMHASKEKVFAQAYTYLKTLPEFAGTLDC